MKKMKTTRKKAFPSAWILRLLRNMLKISLELSSRKTDPIEEPLVERLGIYSQINTHHLGKPNLEIRKKRVIFILC